MDHHHNCVHSLRSVSLSGLAVRAQQGDVAARNELLKATYRLLQQFVQLRKPEVYRNGVSPDDTPSIVIYEVFCKGAIRLYEPQKQSWEGFIRQRAVWRIKDGLGAETPFVYADGDSGAEWLEARDAGEREPIDILIRRQIPRLVRRAIMKIKNRLYRRALILNDYLFVSGDEGARRLGVQHGTYTNAVWRAKETLRALLEDYRP